MMIKIDKDIYLQSSINILISLKMDLVLLKDLLNRTSLMHLSGRQRELVEDAVRLIVDNQVGREILVQTRESLDAIEKEERRNTIINHVANIMGELAEKDKYEYKDISVDTPYTIIFAVQRELEHQGLIVEVDSERHNYAILGGTPHTTYKIRVRKS